MFEFLFGASKCKRKSRKNVKKIKSCKPRRYNVKGSPCNRLSKTSCRSKKYCNYTKRGCRRAKNYAQMDEYIAVMGTPVSPVVAQVALNASLSGEKPEEIVKNVIEASTQAGGNQDEVAAVAVSAAINAGASNPEQVVTKVMVDQGTDPVFAKDIVEQVFSRQNSVIPGEVFYNAPPALPPPPPPAFKTVPGRAGLNAIPLRKKEMSKEEKERREKVIIIGDIAKQAQAKQQEMALRRSQRLLEKEAEAAASGFGSSCKPVRRRKRTCGKPRRYNVPDSSCNKLRKNACKTSGCTYTKRGCRRTAGYRMSSFGNDISCKSLNPNVNYNDCVNSMINDNGVNRYPCNWNKLNHCIQRKKPYPDEQYLIYKSKSVNKPSGILDKIKSLFSSSPSVPTTPYVSRPAVSSKCGAYKNTQDCLSYTENGMYPCNWANGRLNICRSRGSPVSYNDAVKGKYGNYLKGGSMVPFVSSPAAVPPVLSLTDTRGIY
jgi:hypothetical protein